MISTNLNKKHFESEKKEDKFLTSGSSTSKVAVKKVKWEDLASSSDEMKHFGAEKLTRDINTYWKKYSTLNSPSTLEIEKKEQKSTLSKESGVFLGEKLGSMGSEKVLPTNEKTSTENPTLDQCHCVIDKIKTKIDKYQDVMMTFTNEGTWKRLYADDISWLQEFSHLNQEIIVLKKANCACQKQKEKEEQKTKIMASIQAKIENRKSFAVVFDKEHRASIYELGQNDVNWFEYITNANRCIFDYLANPLLAFDFDFTTFYKNNEKRIRSFCFIFFIWLLQSMAILGVFSRD